MKKILITSSVVAAAFMAAGFANSGTWLPALGCVGWEVFVLLANTIRKPRRAGRSKQEAVELRPLYSYDNTLQHWTQDMYERWRA